MAAATKRPPAAAAVAVGAKRQCLDEEPLASFAAAASPGGGPDAGGAEFAGEPPRRNLRGAEVEGAFPDMSTREVVEAITREEPTADEDLEAALAHLGAAVQAAPPTVAAANAASPPTSLGRQATPSPTRSTSASSRRGRGADACAELDADADLLEGVEDPEAMLSDDALIAAFAAEALAAQRLGTGVGAAQAAQGETELEATPAVVLRRVSSGAFPDMGLLEDCPATPLPDDGAAAANQPAAGELSASPLRGLRTVPPSPLSSTLLLQQDAEEVTAVARGARAEEGADVKEAILAAVETEWAFPDEPGHLAQPPAAAAAFPDAAEHLPEEEEELAGAGSQQRGRSSPSGGGGSGSATSTARGAGVVAAFDEELLTPLNDTESEAPKAAVVGQEVEEDEDDPMLGSPSFQAAQAALQRAFRMPLPEVGEDDREEARCVREEEDGAAMPPPTCTPRAKRPKVDGLPQEEQGSVPGLETKETVPFYEEAGDDEDAHPANGGELPLPPPTCSPPPSPPSPPPTPVQGQFLIREGSDRGDFLKFFVSGESFASAYTVGRKIGEGGFGKVFMAQHRVLGLSRAVKRLNKTQGRNDSHKNELAALLALDHPHIVKLVEYYDEERYLYLVFELCVGPDLFDRVATDPSGRMGEFDASVALRHMLKALQCCHSKYRGHFDIKPENFMYATQDLSDLKMIDLGMSSGFDLHRRRHKIKGTAAYMAPELWRGTYGPEADIWSCGVVLFVMLTGEPVLPNLTPATMKCESKVGDLLRRRLKYAATNFNLSDKAQDLLGLMLQHDRHGRPTVREALKHPFCHMSYENEKSTPHRMPEAVFAEGQRLLRRLPEILRNVCEEPMLKRVARLAMAHVGKVWEPAHVAFRMLDWHGYGELSVSVLRNDFQGRGVDVPEDLDQLFEAIDLLREGYISYLTFLSVTLPAESRRDASLCTVAFNILDRNKDGFIDTSDLASVFGNEQVCRGILNEVSFEGKLALSGFLQMLHEDVRMSEHPFCWTR